MLFWSFPSLQFRDTTQHCALKVKHRSCLIYSLLFPPTSGSHKHPKEKSIFSMAKRNSRSARGWSEAGFESGWNYSETFVRTGTAPRNQGNSLDTKQRPQNTLNIFWSVNSSPLLLMGVILETSVLSAITAVTSTGFSRVLLSMWDKNINQNSAWPGSWGRTAITSPASHRTDRREES